MFKLFLALRMAPALSGVLGIIETVTLGSNGLDLGVSDLTSSDLDLNLRSNDLKGSYSGTQRFFSLQSKHHELSSNYDLDPGAGGLDLRLSSASGVGQSQKLLVNTRVSSTLPPECISVNPADKLLRELCGFIDDGKGEPQGRPEYFLFNVLFFCNFRLIVDQGLRFYWCIFNGNTIQQFNGATIKKYRR